jgi:hypothetical protein
MENEVRRGRGEEKERKCSLLELVEVQLLHDSPWK